MAEITTTQTMGNKTITTTINTAARGPAGSDAEVTAGNVTTAIAAATAEQAADMRVGLDAEEARLMHARLWRFRAIMDDGGEVRIGMLGDSMVTTGQATTRTAIQNAFGDSGYCFLEPYASSGATKYLGATGIFNDWWTGTIARLSASGHTATVNLDNAVGVEANTLKLYYVTKSGGGTFKIQTRQNAGAWTDEASYLTVSADGATAGSVITIAKTNPRSTWEIRAVWVSGGAVDIIGGAMYHTALRGARFGVIGAGSTDLAQWITAPTAVVNPIMADIGLDLAILSHLDGASEVVANQATFQDFINTASGTAPSWVSVGPPVGQTDEEDVLREAQGAAMKTLADTRRDAYWDNRRWAGTPAQAIASGLHDGASDPHYETLAVRNWITNLINDLALANSTTRSNLSGASFAFIGGPQIRRDIDQNSGGASLEIPGNLRLCSPAGSTGVGQLILNDLTGASAASDNISIFCQADAGFLARGGSAKWAWTSGIGRGGQWHEATSSAATPQGQIGNVYNPIHTVCTGGLLLGYVAKTANYTIGLADCTINVTANSPTITLPTAVNALGQIYVIANTGVGAVTMATTSSQTIDGSAPGPVAASARLKVQSTGANWITIP